MDFRNTKSLRNNKLLSICIVLLNHGKNYCLDNSPSEILEGCQWRK